MYYMKNIVSFEEKIILPNCMYCLKNPASINQKDTEINISDQKMPKSQLLDLENRQDKLLEKLDFLYGKIKKIRSLCLLNNETDNYEVMKQPTQIEEQEEIVIILNSDNLPWFLNIFLKHLMALNVSWHIHSSVSTSEITKINSFFKKYESLYIKNQNPESKTHFRLIFKSKSATPELKMSSLDVPILGNVNIIRYVCFIYGNPVAYDYQNYELDGYLDNCHQLENSLDEWKETHINNIFANINSKNWIYNDKFSIVDLAVFNAIKQLKKTSINIPKKWLNECEKLML